MYLQAYICTMSVVKYLPNVSVTVPYLYRVVTATFITVFIPPQSAKSHPDAALRSLTIRNLPSSSVRVWTTASRPSMNSQKCVPFEWASWKAGARNTTDRMWRAHRAGLKFTWTVHYSGLTKFSLRWARHWTQSLQSHDCCWNINFWFILRYHHNQTIIVTCQQELDLELVLWM